MWASMVMAVGCGASSETATDLCSQVRRIAIVRAVVESLGMLGWSRIRRSDGEGVCSRELLMVVIA